MKCEERESELFAMEKSAWSVIWIDVEKLEGTPLQPIPKSFGEWSQEVHASIP
jgi:hypothetical protein